MNKVTSMDMFHSYKTLNQVIFMFSADWCPDCKAIEPILPEIEKAYSQYEFYYVDRDQFIEIYQEMEIFGIPSFVAFKEGKEIGRFVSKERKTKEEIENFILGLSY